jgi:hypothetical protein
MKKITKQLDARFIFEHGQEGLFDSFKNISYKIN